MSEAATVFKFCSAAGGAKILRDNCIFVTSPLDLNDPFEMRPAWTNEHQERHRHDKLKRNKMVKGMPAFAAMEGDKLAPIGKLPPLPEPQKTDVNNQRGVADQHNQQVFQWLHNRYRVLSFCTEVLDIANGRDEGNEMQTLMWSHYADMFQGVCLAIDSTKINNGLKSGGFAVKYEPIRRFLPPSFYDCWQSLEHESVQMHGIEFKKSPESPLYLMEHNQEEEHERQLLEFLQHKSPVWAYEHEVRIIYDLVALRKSGEHTTPEFPCQSCKDAKKSLAECEQPLYRDAVRLPPDAIRAVIFGTDTSVADAKNILDVLSDARYANVSLYWSSLHSERYVIQYNKSDRTYVEFIQGLRTKNVAYAKGHVRHAESETQLLPTRKTENFIMKKAADKGRQL